LTKLDGKPKNMTLVTNKNYYNTSSNRSKANLEDLSPKRFALRKIWIRLCQESVKLRAASAKKRRKCSRPRETVKA
jgi:hypothetical protein